MRPGRRIIYLIIVSMLTTNLVWGQKRLSWHYPAGSPYWFEQHDTIRSDDGSIWRVKKGDQLYEFYPDGNIQAISTIKQTSTEEALDTNKITRITRLYSLDGFSKIYFDTSKRILAVSTWYDDPAKATLFYDQDGHLIQKDYPVMFARRSDHFSLAGEITESEDSIWADKEYVEVRRVVFKNGKESMIFDRPFIAKFLLNYADVLAIIMLICIFARVPINYILYNRETPNSVFDFSRFGGRMGIQLRVLCTFWWPDIGPESGVLIICHNILSIIGFGLFLGMTFYTVFHPVSFHMAQ